MKYKIAVCDDNNVDQDYVIGFLNTWARLNDRSIEIHTFISAEEFLFQYADEKDYHVLILDIEMGKMNGVELARELRMGNSELQIIFVTGFPDFIAEGYDVDAIHYLMKPLERDRFYKAMDKAIERIRLVEPYIILREKGEILRLNLRNILYVEVFSHSCVIHTTGGLIEQKVSITELENSFGEQFVRVHRSYLVNLERVKQIGKTEIVLENDEIVPLSRRKYNEVNLAFIRYFKGKI